MCGISLVIQRNGARVDEAWLRSANRALRHRGPDEQSVFCSGSIGLGHVRLAIVDVAEGRQPLFNEDRTVVVVCNGEIYNHAELRRRLVERGHVFQGRSDCEVIAHLYEEDPQGYVGELRGMFAFVLVDLVRQRVELARDHFGIKPLFYRIDDSILLASSEAKAIFLHPAGRATIDGNVVHDFLTFGYTPDERTVWEGIRSVPPATRLSWRADRDEVQLCRYWTPCFGGPSLAVPEVRDVLHQVVADHAMGDGEVGLYLSGGLDSSGLAALLAANVPYRPAAFSLSFPDAAFDEYSFARDVAGAFDLRGHQIRMDELTLDRLARALYHLEQPQIFALDQANLALAGAAQAAGLKAVLAGDGADELLGGYDHFAIDAARRRSGGWGVSVEAALRDQGYPADFSPQYRDILAHDSVAVQEWLGVFPPWYVIWKLSDQIKAPLTRGAWTPTLSPDGPLARHAASLKGPLASLTEFDRATWLETQTRLPNWILWKGDRNAMAHSIEVRVPYLDLRTVDAFWSNPEHLRAGPACEKRLLRKVFDGILPPAVVRRRKHAFNTPIMWAFSGADPRIDAMLSRESVESAGLFHAPAVAMLLAQVRDGLGRPDTMLHRLRAQTLFGVLTTQLLHAIFVSGAWSQPDGA